MRKRVSRILARSVKLITAGLLLSCSQDPGPLPNIVMIVADDLGWRDLGFMGSSYYETPNMDRLAGEGRVFMQGYAAAANCAPSRACLMTGRYSPAHGVYTVGSSERGDERLRKIIPAENRQVLPGEFITLAETLGEAGYTTLSIGKLHLGEDPCSQGFDLNVGGGHWGHPKSYFAPYTSPDLEAPEGEYLTDRLTGEAIRFVREHADVPFFLYLPYYAVHSPIQAKPPFEEKYLEKGARGCQGNAGYAGMVDNLDRCIGLLMDEISTLGLDQHTLVIFTSDNGGIRDISCLDPLRAGKGSYYEGGIRVPLVFRWPGRIIRGVEWQTPAINIDFFPTILDLLGLDPGSPSKAETGEDNHGKKPVDRLDGISLWPLLSEGKDLPERSLFFHFPVYLQAYRACYDDGRDPLFRTRPGSVIRKGDWKLHYFYEDGAVELYNLKNDLGERHDLSGEKPSLSKELITELKVWLEGYDAPVAFEPNPAYDPEFEKEQLTLHAH